MKFGLTYFPVRPAFLLPAAQHADELGYESLWISEHLVFPTRIETKYPYDATLGPPLPNTPLFDPLITLAHIAALTRQIQLGTAIYVLTLRHPIITAKAVATLDALSGGRVMLGAGAGWLKEEFDAVGETWEHRGARLDEIIQVMRRLWTEERVAHQGRFYRFEEVGFEPKPARAPVPILVGGETPAALKRAARLGDGWLGVQHTPESAKEIVAQLKALREDDRPFQITLDPGTAPSLDDVRRMQDAGVDRLVFNARLLSGGGKTLEAMLDGLSRFADEVMRPSAL